MDMDALARYMRVIQEDPNNPHFLLQTETDCDGLLMKLRSLWEA